MRPEVLKKAAVMLQQRNAAVHERGKWYTKLEAIRKKIDRRLTYHDKIRPIDYEGWQFATKRLHEVEKLIRRLTVRRELLLVRNGGK